MANQHDRVDERFVDSLIDSWMTASCRKPIWNRRPAESCLSCFMGGTDAFATSMAFDRGADRQTRRRSFWSSSAVDRRSGRHFDLGDS